MVESGKPIEERVADLEGQFEAHTSKLSGLMEKHLPVSAKRVEALTDAYRESLDDYGEMVVELQLERTAQATALASQVNEIVALRDAVQNLSIQIPGLKSQVEGQVAEIAQLKVMQRLVAVED